MSYEEMLNRLGKLKEQALSGGGEEKIKGQHQNGKKTARERLTMLLDGGSFVEIDQLIRHRSSEFGLDKRRYPGDGVVAGHGTINGRNVCVYSQDFTVLGGTLGEMHAAKIVKIMDQALKTGTPLIGINDSGGARIQEGIKALNGYGEMFYRHTLASGVIPQISIIMGPCAGGAVYGPALGDFIFAVDETSKMFITGPEVVKSVTGEDISPEELGGAESHARVSGVNHFHYSSEEDCFAAVRKLLDYLPANNADSPARAAFVDPIDRMVTELNSIVPLEGNKGYDVRTVLEACLDNQEFFEVQQEFAANIVVGFGRLGGITVGVIANQPKILGGCLDINASDKAARFVRFCDAFNIPLLTFVDTPGYLPGRHQEHGGIIRHGAKLLYAFSEATVPKLTLIMRKAYGGAYIAMCSRALKADRVIAWPMAEIAVMGAEGAAKILFKKEIVQSANPDKNLQERIAEYEERFCNPYVATELGLVDMVIKTEETRNMLLVSLHALLSKRENRVPKKHGNIPL